MHLEKRGFVIFLQWPMFWDFIETILLNYILSGIWFCFPLLWRIFGGLGPSPSEHLGVNFFYCLQRILTLTTLLLKFRFRMEFRRLKCSSWAVAVFKFLWLILKLRCLCLTHTLYSLVQWIGYTFGAVWSQIYFMPHQKCIQFTGPNCSVSQRKTDY